MAEASARPMTGDFNSSVVVAVCFAVAVLEGYDVQALGVVAPALGRVLHLAKDQIGFAGSAAMLGLMIGAWLGGWLADRVGRRPILVGAVAWFGVFSLVTTAAVDANTLMLARLATGLGFGAAMPNMIALAAEVSGPGRRAATVTTMWAGLPTGGALAALVTRFVSQDFDWRLIFIIGGVLPLAIAPFALWLLPETRPTGAVGERRSIPALFGGGRATTTLLLWLALVFTLAALHFIISWLPTLAIAKGLPGQAASLAAVCFNLGSVAGGLVLGRLVDRVGCRWPLTGTYLGTVATMAALAAGAGASSVLVVSALLGFLINGGVSALFAMAPSYYPSPVRATGTGAAVGVGRFGAIAGPSIGGLLLAGGASAEQVVQFVIPIVVAAGLAAVLLAMVGSPFTEYPGSSREEDPAV